MFKDAYELLERTHGIFSTPLQEGLENMEYQNLSKVLFLMSVDFNYLRKSQPNLQFLQIIVALPSSGKDFMEQHVFSPFQISMLHANEIRHHRFDEKAKRLREQGEIKTQKGQPLTGEELILTGESLMRDGIADLLEGNQFNIWQAPGGTGLLYADNHNLYRYQTREYQDFILLDLLNELSQNHHVLLKNLYINFVTITRGPWMDIWAWYRQLIQDSNNIHEANNINKIFKRPNFYTQAEYLNAKVGGSILQVEKAQQMSWVISQYALHNITNLPNNFTIPLASDVTIANHLLTSTPKKSAYRNRVNLSLSVAYFQNFSLSKKASVIQPARLAYTNVVNNPPIDLQSYDEQEQLRKLISAGKEAYGINY